MSLRTLPLLYLNLGGEMLYILDQRLNAQKICGSKSIKVLDDIVRTMFNRKFLEEIFLKHQAIENRSALRAIFDKLAHASIMRLNETSMDKLYDLMVMAFKHQVMMSKNPHDMIFVTLNHLDAIGDYAKSEEVRKCVEFAYELLIQSYVPLTVDEMRSIRCGVLNFLQDYNVRVSIFVHDRKQNEDGSFRFGPIGELPRDSFTPGEIRMFDSSGEIVGSSKFDAGAEIRPPQDQGRLGILDVGHRGTKHGLNMYSHFGAESAGPMHLNNPDQAAEVYRATSSSDQQRLAKQELDLLAKLIGGDESAKTAETFKLNLFDKGKNVSFDESGGKSDAAPPEASDVVKFDLKGQSRRVKELEKVIDQMEEASKPDQDEDDLLALMDKAI